MKLPLIRFALVAATLTLSSAWAQEPAQQAAAAPVERAAAGQTSPPPADRALRVLDQLEAGEFEAIAASFAPALRSQVDAGHLEQVWTSLPRQIGALQSRGAPTVTEQGGLQVTTVPLQFEQAVINAVVAFDAGDRLAGLLLQPAAAPAE